MKHDNTVCILVLPLIFGEGIIWYSYGISEVLVSIIGVFILQTITPRNRFRKKT